MPAGALQIDRLGEHREAVLVDVLVVGVLVDLEAQGRHLGEHELRNARLHEQADAGHRVGAAQKLRELIGDALHAHDLEPGGELRHRGEGGLLHGEPELG